MNYESLKSELCNNYLKIQRAHNDIYQIYQGFDFDEMKINKYKLYKDQLRSLINYEKSLIDRNIEIKRTEFTIFSEVRIHERGHDESVPFQNISLDRKAFIDIWYDEFPGVSI